jgi:hypothetical protein
MGNKEVIDQLFNSLGLAHLSSTFLSMGYNRLQDVVCIRKDDIEMLIRDPEEKVKFLQGLYEGKL